MKKTLNNLMTKIRYYIFSIKWTWKNRDWNNDRHKWKMMDRDYRRYLIEREQNKQSK